VGFKRLMDTLLANLVYLPVSLGHLFPGRWPYFAVENASSLFEPMGIQVAVRYSSLNLRCSFEGGRMSSLAEIDG
jgi:hypothetical protein